MNDFNDIYILLFYQSFPTIITAYLSDSQQLPPQLYKVLLRGELPTNL